MTSPPSLDLDESTAAGDASDDDPESNELSPSRQARLAYQPALDGVRGIGLFFVMASHHGFDWARGGFLWVSSFFTLSGYLITSLLIAEHRRHGSINLLAFWARRFRRLMPAAVVTLIAVVAFGWLFADPAQLARLRGDGISALFYVANWRFIATGTAYADLFASPSPVQHFWTLSIEEQFYAFFPVLLIGALLLSRGRWKTVAMFVAVLTAASIAWMLYLTSRATDVDRLYFGTDTRLPELSSGVLLAIVLSWWDPSARRSSSRAAHILGPLALAAIIVMTFTVNRTDSFLYRGGFAAYAALSCVMIVGAIQDKTIARRLLSFRPLVAFGLLSYAAYLLHWPVYLVLSPERVQLGAVALFGLRFVVTVVLAWLVFRFVEHPIRSGRRLHRGYAVASATLAFALIPLGFVVETRNLAPLAVDLTGEDQLDPPNVAPGSTKVMIVGDSQAWVLGNALRRWSGLYPSEASVWNAARRGCGIVRGGEADRLGTISTGGECENWEAVWSTQLDRFDPDVLIVMSSGWDWIDRKLPEWDDFKRYGDPLFDAHMLAEYNRAADLLTSRGAQVIWYNNPCYELESFSHDPRHANNNIIPDVVASHDGSVRMYDFFADLCPGGAYSKKVGEFSNGRPDGIHLSDEAADWVATWLMPRMLEMTR